MNRRKIDPETKMAAVLEGLKSESSIADMCRKYSDQRESVLPLASQVFRSWEPGFGFPEGLGSRSC